MNVEDHELEELESFDRAGDEIPDPRRADELDRRVGHGVDRNRSAFEKERVELRPRPPCHRIGISRLHSTYRDVVERLPVERVHGGYAPGRAGREKSRFGFAGGAPMSDENRNPLSLTSSKRCVMFSRSSS